MDTMIFSKEQEEFLNKLKEKQGLLDAAIVFAPAGHCKQILQLKQ